MFKSFSSFAGGEIIFFGEHSVVYGKKAVACAINRGISISFVSNESGVMVRSQLGEANASIESGQLIWKDCPESLESLFSFMNQLYGVWNVAPIPCVLQIQSEIPEQSGLASSAAVSSALVAGLMHLHQIQADTRQKVDWVFLGELEIQKRGSILGSACTMSGGYVIAENHAWSTDSRLTPTTTDLIVVDTLERCPTSKSTAIVKALLDQKPSATHRCFEEMGKIAEKGIQALQNADWQKVGALMNDNQTYLRELGVSTQKIDSLLDKCRELVFGGKITGAGGGGCIFFIPKPNAANDLRQLVHQNDCRCLEVQLTSEGAKIQEGALR